MGNTSSIISPLPTGQAGVKGEIKWNDKFTISYFPLPLRERVRVRGCKRGIVNLIFPACRRGRDF